jgi:hypothetical protein
MRSSRLRMALGWLRTALPGVTRSAPVRFWLARRGRRGGDPSRPSAPSSPADDPRAAARRGWLEYVGERAPHLLESGAFLEAGTSALAAQDSPGTATSSEPPERPTEEEPNGDPQAAPVADAGPAQTRRDQRPADHRPASQPTASRGAPDAAAPVTWSDQGAAVVPGVEPRDALERSAVGGPGHGLPGRESPSTEIAPQHHDAVDSRNDRPQPVMPDSRLWSSAADGQRAREPYLSHEGPSSPDWPALPASPRSEVVAAVQPPAHATAGSTAAGGWPELHLALQPRDLRNPVRPFVDPSTAVVAAASQGRQMTDDGSSVVPPIRDRRWPALPDEVDDVPASPATALSAWERRQRLDREQRSR